MRAFARAFGRLYTYDLRHNGYLRFGLLWGLPVPLFSIALDLHAAPPGHGPLEAMLAHPFHLFFLAHPLFFGLLFGAMGTVRHDLEVENDHLIARLTTMAMTDALTGLHNRRYTMEALRAGIHRARRNGERLALVLFDLDGFKAVNERLGHLAGDRVLREVAEALRGVLRRSETLGRYGGDEFMLVTAGDLERTEMVVARARAAVKRRTTLGVSAGIARSGEDGDTPDELVAAADERLARVKRARRRRSMGAA
jgi:diguanylate cyclase (GGDEF)-like protein